MKEAAHRDFSRCARLARLANDDGLLDAVEHYISLDGLESDNP
jgi:hypothetical protein